MRAIMMASLLSGGLLAQSQMSGCPVQIPGPSDTYVTDFREGRDGWEALFADYDPNQADDVDAVAQIAPLPDELGVDGNGLRVGGSNVSDDLAMLLVRRLGPEDGIRRNTEYDLRFWIVLASDAPSGCAGIGGAPGEGVVLKAGAANVKPAVAVDDNGILRLNVDIGAQSNNGPAATVIGDVANGVPCECPDLENPPHVSIVRAGIHDERVRSNDAGELYLIVGTDSGFEGRTELYYQRIEVTATPILGGS